MKWIKLLVLTAIALLLASQFNNPVIAHINDKNWLVDYINHNGFTGNLVIFVSSVVFLAISGPKQLIALMFGYIYHLYLGTALALLACMIAAALNYITARSLLSVLLCHHFPNRMAQFNDFAQYRPFLKILLLRLFPIGNNVVTNVLSGSVKVPSVAFFSASLLGYIPQTVIFALMGSGIKSSSNTMVYLSITLAILSTILTGYIYRDHIKTRVENLNTEPKK